MLIVSVLLAVVTSAKCPDAKGIETDVLRDKADEIMRSAKCPDAKGIETTQYQQANAQHVSAKCPDAKGIETFYPVVGWVVFPSQQNALMPKGLRLIETSCPSAITGAVSKMP